MNGDNLTHFLLRLVSGGLFILFGWMKLSGQSQIISFLPVDISVIGGVEVLLGVLLVIGMWTQISAWLSALLVGVVLISGAYLGLFMQLGLIKDLPLLVIFIVLGLLEPEEWSVDGHINRPGIHTLKKRLHRIKTRI